MKTTQRLLTFFLITFSALHISFAGNRESLIKDMQAARKKLDTKAPLKNPEQGEPKEDRFKEFSKLVDDSYLELEAEKGNLSTQEKMNNWVILAALSLYLDPRMSVVYFVAEVEKQDPSAFKTSLALLDNSLRDKIKISLKLQKEEITRGNGG